MQLLVVLRGSHLGLAGERKDVRIVYFDMHLLGWVYVGEEGRGCSVTGGVRKKEGEKGENEGIQNLALALAFALETRISIGGHVAAAGLLRLADWTGSEPEADG